MKPRLTFEEHQQLGKELSRIKAELQTIVVKLDNSYPRQTKEVRFAWKALAFLNELRCKMDSNLATEYPDDFSPKVYYGKDPERSEHHPVHVLPLQNRIVN